MKVFLLQLIAIFPVVSAWSQADSLTNSFAAHYEKTNPWRQYRYEPGNQVHDYSGNWDLDGDGRTDQVLFVGTGGAHLYYFLRIVLSSDSVTREYPFLQSDFPVFTAITDEQPSFFAAEDFDGDGITDIFIRLDKTSLAMGEKQLRKQGMRTRNILLTFKKAKPQFRDLYQQK